MIKRLFTDEVALFMRLSYHPIKATASDFARAFKCDRRTIERLLIGSTYADVPGGLGPLKTVPGNCYLSDEMVLKARRAFRRKTATIKVLAKRYDVETMVMSRAIRGLTYTHLPLAVKGKIKYDRKGIGRSTPKAREEQIVRVRCRVADPNDPFTREDAARELGVGDSSVVRYLTGQRYPHLPHAVPLKVITKYGYNACTFTPEQVVAIRADYRKPKVTLTGLAVAYGVSREVIEFVLDGTKYPEIPGVLTAAEIAAKKNRRTMTNAQVLQARRRFRTRYVTVHEIAVEFGMSIQGAENMLRGFSYKDVPEAVPEHIKPIRRGRNFVPKKLRAKYRLPPQPAVPFLQAAE